MFKEFARATAEKTKELLKDNFFIEKLYGSNWGQKQ